MASVLPPLATGSAAFQIQISAENRYNLQIKIDASNLADV
jgi:hypothetical protein